MNENIRRVTVDARIRRRVNGRVWQKRALATSITPANRTSFGNDDSAVINGHTFFSQTFCLFLPLFLFCLDRESREQREVTENIDIAETILYIAVLYIG